MKLFAAVVLWAVAGASSASAQNIARPCQPTEVTHVLCHEVETPLIAADAWRLWATSEGLVSWMAPMAIIDLRVGGAIEASYDPAAVPGQPGNIRNRIVSFEPERSLAIQIAQAPPGFPHADEARRLQTLITFEPAGVGTRVRVIMTGFEASEAFDALRAFFGQGNAATLTAFARRASEEAPR